MTLWFILLMQEGTLSIGGKLLFIRKMAVIASAVLALGSAGLAFSGPASADTTQLCNNNLGGTSACAYTSGSGYVSMAAAGSIWIYHPNTSATEIRLDGTNDCMTIDSGNSRIEMATCESSTDQLWAPTSTSGGFTYTSESNAECLNDHYQLNEVNVATCNGGEDEIWFAP
jgi:hypothetical protein